MQKNILCYGDSNTFGSIPGGGRWPLEVRWTGRLQALLESDYRIIEEGCGGRTTVWEDFLELDKNGRKSLPVALASHKPLDLVILMLGTNDMKTRFSALPADIAAGAGQLARMVLDYPYGDCYPRPQVLLVSPIQLHPDVEHSCCTGFNRASYEKSLLLGEWMRREAARQGVAFFDAATVAHPSEEDKIHMQPESHAALAEALAAEVRRLLG